MNLQTFCKINSNGVKLIEDMTVKILGLNTLFQLQGVCLSMKKYKI